MESLNSILLIPSIAAVMSLFESRYRLIRLLVPCFLWAQLIWLSYFFFPLLCGKIELIPILPGLAVDRLSAFFALLSTLVVASSLSHAGVFFALESEDSADTGLRVGIFYACSCLFLIAMTAVCLCDNLGYLWVSIEGTTLASAPLVYHARSKHALEATWKYLIICSVGIAFALFGTILIFAAGQHGAGKEGTLEISKLISIAPKLDYSFLRLGFVFCLLGYGTKAGIFPLHSWLPDAHSEAPAPASAMLSGGLLNCALLAIFRLSQIVHASGHDLLAQRMPLVLGVLTVVAASLFLVRQSGLKRLWAYSSIENVGLMLSAIGLGSASIFFLLALNHSLAKVSIFLLSGNIIQSAGTKHLNEIKGILHSSPVWAILLALSAFAVTGAPPFGAFISEWVLLCRSADTGQWWVAGLLTFALTLSFVVVCQHLGKCIWGTPGASVKSISQLKASLMPALLLSCTFIAGTTGLTHYLLDTTENRKEAAGQRAPTNEACARSK